MPEADIGRAPHFNRPDFRLAHYPTRCTAGCALNTVRRIDGLDIFLIDSTVAGAAHGELVVATPSWLDKARGASSTRSALHFLHHPPFDTRIAYTDAVRLRNCDAFAAVLGRHPRVLVVAAGHVHRAAQTVFAGISASICPAGEQAVTLEFEPRWPEVFRIEPPAFHLSHGFPDRDLEAWLLTLYRWSSSLGPIPTATTKRPHPRCNPISGRSSHSFFGNLQRLYWFVLGQPGYGDKWPSQ